MSKVLVIIDDLLQVSFPEEIIKVTSGDGCLEIRDDKVIYTIVTNDYLLSLTNFKGFCSNLYQSMIVSSEEVTWFTLSYFIGRIRRTLDYNKEVTFGIIQPTIRFTGDKLTFDDITYEIPLDLDEGLYQQDVESILTGASDEITYINTFKKL